MQVKDLINELKTLDPEMELIIQIDSEGNGYNPLRGADPNAVFVPSGYGGEVYDINWSAEDACMDKEEWDKLIAGPKCVVLYP